MSLRHFLQTIAWLSVVSCVCATPAHQQSISRRDLAMVYLRLDHAIRNHPPADNDLRRVHTTFDQAMTQMFSRDTAGAMQTMNRLADSIDRNSKPPLIVRWTDEKVNTSREAFANQLRGLKLPEELTDASKACASRINLLTNADVETDSNVFLNSPEQLSKQIAFELNQLSDGRDPYAGYFDTDYWRPIFTKRANWQSRVPCRIFAPKPKSSDAKRPLIIALHGAGGDENMFFGGYGAGLIKDLAIKNDFVVIAPNTFSMITESEGFDAIVRTMVRLYNIDEARVYVVGHSLGAMTTAGLSGRFPDRIRATAQIAGGGMVKGVPKIPPTLVILAELDPLFQVDRMKTMITEAKQTGLPIDYQIAKNIGHAAAVDATLEDAVRFLLEH